MPGLYARPGKRQPALVLCGWGGGRCRGVLADVRTYGADQVLVLEGQRVDGDRVVRRPHRLSRTRTHTTALEPGERIREEEEWLTDPPWPLRVRCPRCGQWNLLDPGHLEVTPMGVVITHYRRVAEI